MSWEKKEISQLCEFAIDCVNKTAPVVDFVTPYKMIRTSNIKAGFIDYETVRYVEEKTYKKWTRRSKPKYGDVIFTREAPVGRVGRFTSLDNNFFLGQRIFHYRTNPKLLDWQFLAYILQSDAIQGWVHGIAFGATVPHIKVEDAEKLKIPCPPIHIQQKIARILSAYDDLIENNLKRIKLLEEMAQLTYEEWFVRLKFPGHEQAVIDPETGLPEGWRMAKLFEEVKLIKNSVLPENLNSTTRYIGLEHMPRKSITLSEYGVASDVSSLKTVVKKGDIVFGKIRPYFHKVGIALVDCISSTDAIVVKASHKMEGLILQVMFSNSFVSAATQSSNGTKMPRANWNVLKNYEFIIPAAHVLHKYADLSETIISSISNLVDQNQHLKEARDILLPRLMTGMIDVESLELPETGTNKTTPTASENNREASIHEQ